MLKSAPRRMECAVPMEFLLYTGALVLGFVCLLTVLVILMQRPSANAGMGASLGGGAAESAFGGEAGNVLTKATTILIITFLVLSLGLFLGFKALYGKKTGKSDSVFNDLTKTAPATAPATPAIAPAPAEKAPATTTPTATAPVAPVAPVTAEPAPTAPAAK
jgi:preprotein translocase subunit SecG